jgi:excisionase family DNA binding protein
MSTVYVDREEASKLLKVSTRTLDRYVRKYRLKTRRDGRRILLQRHDLDTIIKQHIGHFLDMTGTEMTAPEKTTETNESTVKVKDIKVESVKEKTASSAEEKVYQQLFVEVKKELKEKQERLDAATYRVGQLEAQIKSTVPLLDYNRKEKELSDAYQLMEQKNAAWQAEILKTEQKLRAEKVTKWIYLSLTGLLLVAEPILFLLWAFS